MNPLLLTITFLTLLGLLTSSEMQNMVEEGLKSTAFQSHLNFDQEVEKSQAVAAFEELKDKESPTKPSPPAFPREKGSPGKSAPLNYDHARPPNNSRLNLYLLMNDEHPKAHYLYESTADLLRQLYGSQDFFKEIPHVEYALLNTLIEHREKAEHFFFADELGSLHFKDTHLQRIFYKMLKGSPDYPSLLHFITFDAHCGKNQRKVNFMFAPQEVIVALITDQHLCQKLLNYREALWAQIEEQEKNRHQLSSEAVKNRTFFKTELMNFFKENADKEIYQLFDYSLGKKGSIVYVQDPISGIVSRERILKKRLD